MRRVFELLIILCAFAGACGAAPRFELGVTTHLTSDDGLAHIARASLGSIRNDLNWEITEKEKDRLVMHPRYEHYVNEALRCGLRPLLILDYGNPHYDSGEHPRSPEAVAGYVRFCEFVVRHFRGRVFQYEIWNEWNAGTSMGLPGVAEDYVKLLAAAREAIRRIAPEVTVIGGVMSGNGLRDGWLEDACNAGLLEHLDALSFHPYSWGSPDENDRLPEFGLVKRVRDLEEFIAHYPRGRKMPLYITELGWPTHHGPNGYSKEEAASYFARAALILASMPNVRGMWWYGWSDDGEDETQSIMRFGLTTFTQEPKPAYASAAGVAEFLRGARTPLILRETANTRSVSYRDARGRWCQAAWALRGRETLRLFAKRKAAGQRLVQRTMGALDLQRSWDRRGSRSMVRVTVGPQPTYLTP